MTFGVVSGEKLNGDSTIQNFVFVSEFNHLLLLFMFKLVIKSVKILPNRYLITYTVACSFFIVTPGFSYPFKTL